MGRVLAAYGGGFKPPTRGHFEIVQKALNEFPEIDEFFIYIYFMNKFFVNESLDIPIFD